MSASGEFGVFASFLLAFIFLESFAGGDGGFAKSVWQDNETQWSHDGERQDPSPLRPGYFTPDYKTIKGYRPSSLYR